MTVVQDSLIATQTFSTHADIRGALEATNYEYVDRTTREKGVERGAFPSFIISQRVQPTAFQKLLRRLTNSFQHESDISEPSIPTKAVSRYICRYPGQALK